MHSFENQLREQSRAQLDYFVDYMARTKSVFEQVLNVIQADQSEDAGKVRARVLAYLDEIDGRPNPEVKDKAI